MSKPGAIISQIPEFEASSSIKIAPNTSVPVTPRLLALIDSQTFQRLRRIRQLSIADRVFPSATHTRFSHALGVYNNILDYLRHLDRFPAFHKTYTQEDYLAILLAGLLHDLGHYPYSHQLDHLEPFREHETLTMALLRGEFRFEGENFAQLIRDNFGLDPERVACLIGPTDQIEPRLRLIKQLIDSPNDADKCDYLPRDSYFCGVDYGLGFDRERFIRNLVPSRDGTVLCINEKGLMSAERFQLARYWMYRSVYWGHTVRAFITMLCKACEYFRDLPRPGEMTSKMMGFSDYEFLEWLGGRLADPGRELVDMFHTQRKPYKRLYTISPHHDARIYRHVRDNESARTTITEWFRDWAAQRGIVLKEHHLIWDIPPVYKKGSWESFPIMRYNHDEVPIAEESPVIKALTEAFLYGVRKIRLFGHPELAALLHEHHQKQPALEEFVH